MAYLQTMIPSLISLLLFYELLGLEPRAARMLSTLPWVTVPVTNLISYFSVDSSSPCVGRPYPFPLKITCMVSVPMFLGRLFSLLSLHSHIRIHTQAEVFVFIRCIKTGSCYIFYIGNYVFKILCIVIDNHLISVWYLSP